MRTRRSRALVKQETIIDLNCHEEVEHVTREPEMAIDPPEDIQEGASWDEDEELQLIKQEAFEGLSTTRKGKHTEGLRREAARPQKLEFEPQRRRVACNCKKSRCLKLYCECFAAGLPCQDCGCQCCANQPYSYERATTVEALLEKNPHAF